jgi:hypothetical protein
MAGMMQRTNKILFRQDSQDFAGLNNFGGGAAENRIL